MTDVHALRLNGTTVCGETGFTKTATWLNGFVMPAQVTCRQCRWIGGGGTGPAPERAPKRAPKVEPDFEWPCDRRDAHGPHNTKNPPSAAHICLGVKAHPATMIGRA